MGEPTSKKQYEEKFEFPLWKLIKNRAEKLDISYLKASQEVFPEYVKTIRYRDISFEDTEIKKWSEELQKVAKRTQKGKKALKYI